MLFLPLISVLFAHLPQLLPLKADVSPEFLVYMLCTYPPSNANKTLIIAWGIGKTEKNTAGSI